MYESTHSIFVAILRWSAMAMEVIGALIILLTVIRSLWRMVTKRENVRIAMAEGISLALLFKLAGEVLHTVLADSLKDVALLASIMAVRAAITILLHWEISQEKKEEREEHPGQPDDKK